MKFISATAERVVRYIIEECHRQRSGERSIGWLLNAWLWADEQHRNNTPITVEFIETLGMLVEPVQNKGGFRTTPVFVAHQEKQSAPFIRRNLQSLIEAWYDGRIDGADQFYYEYETIHPFRDGNGRSGKVLLNYLKGTLRNPVMPPNFWNCSNP